MHILTFDIEDWYLSYHSSQIATTNWPLLESRSDRNTKRILEILDHLNVKATFFVLGYEARQNPDLVRNIRRAGHEVGFHSLWHVPLYAQTARDFESDLKEGLAILEDILDEKIFLYRAPLFSLDGTAPWVPEILAANGIRISSSILTGIHFSGNKIPYKPYVWQTHSGSLIEFPMPAIRTGRFVIRATGSGYFRILPIWFLKAHAQRRSYNMFYFHPRDFDLDVPSSPLLPAYRNAMGRLGNHSTQRKLTSLAQSLHFITITEAAKILKVEPLPTIDLRKNNS